MKSLQCAIYPFSSLVLELKLIKVLLSYFSCDTKTRTNTRTKIS